MSDRRRMSDALACRPARELAAGVAGVLLALAGCLPASAADEPPVRDPTRPPYAAIEGRIRQIDDGLLLVSTSVSPASRSAVINDQVVTIGSRIAGAVVTVIEQGRVALSRGSETIVLQLYTPPVKRLARESS